MGTIIAIHRTVGEVHETHFYGKPERVVLEAAVDPAMLWSSAPKVYLTGLSAIHTQKRLAKVLARIDPTATHRLERLAAEDVLGRTGLTAQAYRQGLVKPKYGYGG